MRCVRRYIRMLCLTAAVLTGGCMVGPDYSRPTTPADEATNFVNGSESKPDVNEVKPSGRWWERFGDPITAELVRDALERNYDLKAAAARVLQAQAGLKESRGRLWPDVSYSLTRDRSKRYINFGGDGGGFTDPNLGFDFSGFKLSPLTTTWSQAVSVSYLVDLWGKLRHAERAAWQELLATESNRQALVNSVIAQVIQARINVAMQQKRLDLATANVESLEQTVQITERRYEQGLVGPVDVRLARANLESARSQVPALASTLARARHSLDVLVGRRPGSSPELRRTLPELPELEPPPAGVPAALLDRRPDVQAAEFSLRAANERIGVSIAQLYPDLTLTGSYGTSSDRWEDIWDREFEVYSAITNLAAPIWRGGQIRAQIEAAKARYAEQAANYAAVVLQAMREVEDALIGEQSLQAQIEHVQLQFGESQAAEQLSLQRYQRGVEGLLTVLESERRRRIAEQELAILKGQLWTTRVNLHLALGGDWDSSQDAERQMVKK